MTTNKFSVRRKLSLIALFLALICSCLGLAIGVNQASAVSCDIQTAQEIKTTYLLNELFTIPSANLVHEGDDYPATSKNIVFPNGKVYKNDTVTLSVVGEYSVQYYYESDDLYLYGVKKFTVVDSLYSVSGAASTVSYNGTGIKGTTATGLEVALSAGGVFEYNKPIDLTGRKNTDVILKLFATPDVIGVPDASDLYVKLTDAYNPNNFVTVKTVDAALYADVSRSIQCQQSASAYNQKPTGLRYAVQADGNTVSYDGSNYYVDVNTDKGYRGFFSFCANGGYNNSSHGAYSLSMDYEKKQVFGCKNYASGANGMIIDLDDPLFFDTLWEGFTTGEVFLSVYSNTVLTDTFKFAITNICEEDLSETTVEDLKAPIINVDYAGENESSLPFAKLNKPYKIFDAVAVDNFNVKDEQVAVFYNYRGNNPVQISVKNGYFTPTLEGVYSIAYYAVDGSGLQTYKVVDVNAISTEGLSFDANLSVLEPKTGSAVAFDGVASNASGNVKVVAVATLKSEPGVSYELEIIGDTAEFNPYYAGEYEVKFVVNDYVEKIEKTVSVTVAASDKLVFNAQPSLPYAFVKGVSYNIANYSAISLVDGTPKQITASVKYAFDSEQTQTLSNNRFTVTASEYVKIEYVFSQTEVVARKIPVVDVLSETDKGSKRYDVKNYFYGGGNYSVSATPDYTTYTTDVGGELYFINDVFSSVFSLDFRVSEMNFGALTITLTDTVDTNQKLVARFTQIDDNTTSILLNDEVTYFLSGGMGNKINLSYSKKLDACSINGKTVKIDGFDGFPSGLVRLKLDIEGVTKQSSVEIHRLNDQKISEKNTDSIIPSVYYDFIGYTAELGDEFFVENIVVADVLCFSPTVKISTYTGKNREYCTTKDGIVMKDLTDVSRGYRFTFTKYGEFTLKIELNDDADNIKTYYVKISVEDLEPPVVTIPNKIYTATVGKNINFTDYYRVRDNLDKSVEVTVYIVNPYGIMSELPSKTFTPKIKGSHTLIIYATDDNGNSSSASYSFTVK